MRKIIRPIIIVCSFFCLVIIGFVVLAQWPKTTINGSASGFYFRPQIWKGVIVIKGDTTIAPWVILTIDPGTRVLFQKGEDLPNTDWTKFADAYIKDHSDPTGRVGYNQSHFDLVGKIYAVGTKDQPILFSSAQLKPEYADWDQLVLFGGSILDYTEVSFAHNGVYVGDEIFPWKKSVTTTITNSIIHDSLWSCVDIWSANTVIHDNQIYHCWHQAVGVKGVEISEIKNNFIHDAQLSINCENGGSPLIVDNHLEAAPISPDCPPGNNNKIIDRDRDTTGGIYNSVLIYPSR